MIPNGNVILKEFKDARPGTRLKELLKLSCRAAIWILSRGVPDAVLFRGSVLLRKFGLGLKRVSAPIPFQRAADFLFYNLRYMCPGLVDARIRGERFFIQLNDPCQYDLLLGVHEPEVGQWIVSELKEGMTFFDIGANVGYYTLLGARCVGSSGKVVALEPDPAVAAILRQNIEVNSIENVKIVQGAASRTCGNVKLGHASSSSYGSGFYCKSAVDWIEVPGYSLDALAAELQIPAVDLVKLDVEGAEAETIEGMTKILSEDRPKLIVELHGHTDSADSHPAVQKLKNAGYAMRLISASHVVGKPISAKNADSRKSHPY